MFLFKKEEVTNNLLNEKRAFNKTSIHVSNIMMGFCLCTLFVLKGLTINAQTTPATSNFGCISKYQNVGNWTEEGWQHHGKWYFDGGMNGYITNCNGNNVTIRKWVKQKYNQSPTWWVGEYDMIDVEVTGTMRVYDNSDADWIGFVFGYQGPFGYHSSADSIDGDFLLFDWKQSNEGCCSKEGFSLSRLDGKLPHNLNGTTLRYHYPYLPVYDTIATRYGSTEGWKDYVTNHFKLIYTKTNTTIIINQAGPVSTNPSTNDTIFNVNGTYKPGRFGFYNCSQDNSAYGAVRYRLMKDFEFSDPVICKGGTAELNFLGNDEMNFNYDLIKNMTWIYGDGDIDTISFPDSTTINSTHTYNTAGTYNVMLLIENCSGCIDTAYNTITVTDSEISVINAIDPLCFEDASGSIDITVNDGTAPFQYNWSNGESNEDISNLTAGNYWVTMVDNNGCLDSTNITLTDPALLDLTLSATNETCVGDSDGEIIASPSGGTGSYTYSWTPQNNNSSSLANLTAGSYSLTVEDDNGCTVTKTANLTSYSLPIVTANASQEIICIGEPTQLTGSGADSYTWDNNVTDGDNVSPSVTTTYTVTGTDANTCVNTAQITVTVHNNPIANAGIDGLICPGDDFPITASGGGSYFWPHSGEATATITVSPSVDTWYTVEVTNSFDCENSDSVLIELIVPGFTEAMNDTGTVENIYFIEIDAGQNDLGDLSTIAIISNPANGNCSVNPTNGVITYQPDPGFVGTDTIKYIICDEDCNNSCDEGFIYITVIDEVLLEIPNGFSPNGDGINDELIIEGLYKYPENEITIFNRWGDQVYYAKPYNNDWDGYGNNNSMLIGENKLIDGTYFYYFKYDNEHSVQSGNIELKRK